MFFLNQPSCISQFKTEDKVGKLAFILILFKTENQHFGLILYFDIV